MRAKGLERQKGHITAMKKAIVIGSGAGGAMMAKELAGHFQVTVLEAGDEFKPFSRNVDTLLKFRKTGLFLDESMISWLFPDMKIMRSSSDIVLVYGICTGGTTTLATGNALRYDKSLKKIGINLDEEFDELASEIPVSTDHQKFWSQSTKELFEVCKRLGYDPVPTGKLVDYSRCTGCGRCVLGCSTGAKWDSRALLREAIAKGAEIRTDCKVTKLETDPDDNTVKTVCVKEKKKEAKYSADLVVLAAGGLNTPVILENSGISCESTLFVDPVLCVAARYRGAGEDHQIPMPFLVQRNGYILSPYMDYLSLFFNKSWRLPPDEILSMMIKLADSEEGASTSDKLEKTFTGRDIERLRSGVADCTAILKRMGIAEDDIFLGTVNAGHPGGMLPLTAEESESFHDPRLPANLYVADATLLPESMGNPPIWTILALSKRIARVCIAAIDE